MHTRSGLQGLTSQHLVPTLLVVFIGLSVIAMFTSSKVRDEMSWIGMKVKRLDAETMAARGLPTNADGVIVKDVGGIAGQAGIVSGDLVMGINGNSIRDMFDFLHFTRETDIATAGAQIDLVRNGMRMPVFIFPTEAAAQGTAPVLPVPAGAAGTPLALTPQWLGIEGDTVMAADARELGLPAGAQGVAVDGVAVGSRAQQAGLARRDIIVAVNGRRVNSANGLWNALGSLNGQDSVQLGVYRKGQLVTIDVPAAAGVGAAAGTPAAAQAGTPAVAPAGGFPARMGGAGLGPGGLLACPSCGTRVAHQRGVPCFTVACPSCGKTMTRLQ